MTLVYTGNGSFSHVALEGKVLRNGDTYFMADNMLVHRFLTEYSFQDALTYKAQKPAQKVEDKPEEVKAQIEE